MEVGWYENTLQGSIGSQNLACESRRGCAAVLGKAETDICRMVVHDAFRLARRLMCSGPRWRVSGGGWHANGDRLLRIDTAGNLYLIDGASIHTEQQVIDYNPNTAAFVVRDGNGNILALLDWRPVVNLYLKGKLYENVSFIWQYPQESFLFWNNDQAMAIINSYSFYDPFIDLFGDVPEGSLILDGRVYYDYRRP